MSIIAATGLQAYNNALADFAKARNQVQKSASDIAGASPPPCRASRTRSATP